LINNTLLSNLVKSKLDKKTTIMEYFINYQFLIISRKDVKIVVLGALIGGYYKLSLTDI